METRKAIGHLLNESSPRDALASYYAFHHPRSRTELFLHTDDNGTTDGFLVRARTGHDPFRPLLALRASNEAAMLDLLLEGTEYAHPYYLTALEPGIQVAVREMVTSDLEVLEIHQLDPSRYQPNINAMVQTSTGPSGWPRCRVESNDRIYSTAGVNWLGPKYAEISVFTEAAARRRGWGRAVVHSLVAILLAQGKTPIYAVDQNNVPSLRLAKQVGFVDTGFREYVATVRRYDWARQQ